MHSWPKTELFTKGSMFMFATPSDDVMHRLLVPLAEDGISSDVV